MNIGDSIWLCKKLGEIEEGIINYSEPTEYKLKFNYLTINSTRGYLATIQYGEKLDKVFSIKARRPFFDNVFNEGDLLYVNGNRPNIENANYVNGDGANALITSVLEHLLTYSVTIERLQP